MENAIESHDDKEFQCDCCDKEAKIFHRVIYSKMPDGRSSSKGYYTCCTDCFKRFFTQVARGCGIVTKVVSRQQIKRQRGKDYEVNDEYFALAYEEQDLEKFYDESRPWI